ncbi:MAG: extracellular solute-binding protein [Deltaproteobacteria bacterium]|nr:extracellular solute-binding protein [Deltaproteobacteria bacterium]
MFRGAALGLALSAATAATTCAAKQEIIVFHAPSLSRALDDVGAAFMKQHPETRLRFEVSGSQVAARKLTELNLEADVVALADADVIDKMLRPEVVDWTLRFATNEVVLAHAAHSRYTEEVTTANWPAVLARSDVRFGIASAATSPLGYRTLFVLQLAATLYQTPGLAAALSRRVAAEHTAPDEAELLALLSARAIDYAFFYRSTAEDHRLKLTALPDSINLGTPARDADYRAASVPVVLKHGAPPVVMRGAAVWYGLAVPRKAPHRDAAVQFVAFLLGDAGGRILERVGFRPVTPALCAEWASLPVALQPLARPPGAP